MNSMWLFYFFFFFKQKTAYEMVGSDWSSDVCSSDLAVISTTASGSYVFTPAAGQCATPYTMDVVITNQVTPTFTQIGPLCQNSTAPALPTTSNNNITGTWNPAVISTTASGSYVFTPAAGQCATPYTMDVVITNQVTPTFTQIGPLCQKSTAPALPTTSNNNITGTWNPAVISTTASGSYVFTPAAGQCATPYTMDVVITNQVTPTFTQIGPLCQNSTAPALPTTSNNNITGTWNPAVISTTASGSYVFTPAAGQCATPYTMDVVITNQVTPTFTQIGPLCQNSTAPALPTTSNNNITGTWNPAVISTTASGSYVFTPAAGQCATPYTMDVVITNQVTPTFTQIGPLCQNSTAPALPTTSNNNITGTWNPAVISTTASGSYVFTPAAGQCATPYTMDVVITNQVTPTFTQIGPLCQKSTAPALPTTSNNNITGTWNPAVISTTASGSYVFTPAAGQCATPYTMDVVITNQVTPTFTQIGPLCQNSTAPALPTTSNNNITGTWNPAVISTTASGSYVFTPAAGQCATPYTMDVVITNQVTPTFTQIGPLCQKSTAPALPTTSNNNITGTWNPAVISTTASGSYVFTPAAGQCATPYTMDVVITNQVTPTFTQIGPLCQKSTAPALPTTSNNNITGTWNPAVISTTASGSYVFTPAAGQCATPYTMDVVITNQVTPTFTQIGPLCQNSTAPALPTTSNNNITGTWNPAVISTTASGSYVFTPAAGQCATPYTMDVVITNQVTPTFTQIGPLCQKSTAPALPTTSNNNITGTWNPAVISTTASGSYVFTPAAGQCATPYTMDVVITNQITPTFTQIGPLCLNSSAPVLPTTSNNNITGTWNPAVISTTASGSYVFTPDANQCAAPVTMDIVITSQITPTFTQVGPLCQNSTAPVLPATSGNNITGVWNPATINTSTAGTTTYTFTPTAGQCAAIATMDIVITNQITPVFTQIGPL